MTYDKALYKIWYQAHREQQIEKSKKYWREHHEERMAYERSRSEAKKVWWKEYYKIHGVEKRAFEKAFGEEFVQIKGEIGCERCGVHDGVVIDFHHINRNDKRFSIILREYMSRSLEELINEIGKCRTLCSNCHRRIEWDERHGATDFPQ